MNKKLTVAVAAAALSVSMAVPAMAQWNNLGNNNWQWLENGVAVRDQWVTTENGQYYINLDGLCSYNWINWNGNWYFGQQGSNLGNVVKNGWASVDGNYYYFGADGVMATGTQTINGVTYTFDANGHCTTTPTGVSYATYSTGAAASTSTTTVGGGSSSGGGSGSSSNASEEFKNAYAAKATLNNNLQNMNKAAQGATIEVGSVSGNTVEVTVDATGAVKDSDKANKLISVASRVVEQSGLSGDVKSISMNTIEAKNVADFKEKATKIVGGLTVEQIKATHGDYREIFVTLNDGTEIYLEVEI